MTTQAFGPLEVHGVQPEVMGQACEAIVCEAYECEGRVEATANVSYLRLSGRWHRVAIDCPGIFWRLQDDEPKPYSVPEEGWSFPHTEVSSVHGLSGLICKSLSVKPIAGGCVLQLEFAGGKVFRITNLNDRSVYDVI